MNKLVEEEMLKMGKIAALAPVKEKPRGLRLLRFSLLRQKNKMARVSMQDVASVVGQERSPRVQLSEIGAIGRDSFDRPYPNKSTDAAEVSADGAKCSGNSNFCPLVGMVTVRQGRHRWVVRAEHCNDMVIGLVVGRAYPHVGM